MKKANTAWKDPEDRPVLDEDDIVFLTSQELQRLSKDLRNASKAMTKSEARYLVSNYYAMQDMRKRFVNQERAMEESGEPHDLVSYMAKQTLRMEKQIQVSLDVYTVNNAVGMWLRANKGVGPVIAAGLLAHINIEKAPTYGHIWRYAGMDPTIKWHGKGIADIIRAARNVEPTEWDALLWVSRHIAMRVASILVNAKLLAPEDEKSVEEVMTFLTKKYGKRMETKAVYHGDNAIRELVPEDEQAAVYAELYPKVKLRWEDITKTLAKRPWNGELKTLCWKMGESFKKVSGSGEGKKPSPYGLVYRDRKALEQRLNDNGSRAEIALEVLKKKKVGQTTDAYFWYSGNWVNNPRLNPVLEAEFDAELDRRQGELEKRIAKAKPGDKKKVAAAFEIEVLEDCIKAAGRELKPKLPPAHIDSRASRYAVKLFLSHLHDVMYKRVLGKNPPFPYPVAHMGHVHTIAPFIQEDALDIVDEALAAD